ncbi:hypothetical protein L227DRAFT_655085 [Lentinus tigrinus ALCF2SS1-6]|uniref:Uncharacterized protein n=2 Tax=Lentinus tigrinus TaxID=5365 RepID=A0A5C2S3L6_9APHY|nr:hypothetical protein L227DRAFT_655085 [Lentinus tigrinus ALCF2SS1-6]
MFSYKFATLANLALALCASAHPAQTTSDRIYHGEHGVNNFPPASQASHWSCSTDYSAVVTRTYSPRVTVTETVMTTMVPTPSGQPTQLIARRDTSSSDAPSVPIVTVTSTATYTVTDSTLLYHTSTATATSIVSVTSTITASPATETDTLTVTSKVTAVQSTTTA